jgi:hypothetical protein
MLPEFKSCFPDIPERCSDVNPWEVPGNTKYANLALAGK